eukprot:TRINITY_DN16489_c0_g1_i1.p1 TRINITY_DN16489_c0_g1~~TRINITY_DN16489_c0_g1_i1.p1  ORF type:complete len:284 (-),score=52.77 TRINITY_DN16489_c0_g1_i1:9-860(-)
MCIRDRPYIAFQEICCYSDDGLSLHEIHNFLKEYKVSVADCRMLIMEYDLDGDEKLSYKEFLKLVLPVTDSNLRAVVTQRDNKYSELKKQLPRNIRYSLSSLLITEIENLKIIGKMKANLALKKNFDAFALFSAIDFRKQGRIDYLELEAYLKRRGAGAQARDVAGILKRLDKGLDCKLSFKDFYQFAASNIPKQIATPLKRTTKLQSKQILTPQTLASQQLQEDAKEHAKSVQTKVSAEDLDLREGNLLRERNVNGLGELSLIHICRCRRYAVCRSRWSPCH